MPKKKPSEGASFSDFVPEALDRLQSVSERHLDDFNIHAAFNYWIAELFESTNGGAFQYTDGQNDRSIDFFTQNMQNYSIYQCKCPEASTLESADKPQTYDMAVVNELLEAVGFLRDADGQYKAKVAVRDLRSRYQQDLSQDPENTRLEATLAIMGELTPSAQEGLSAARYQMYEQGVSLNLLTWKDIYDRIHLMTDGSYDDIEVTLHVNNLRTDALHQNDWVYALVYAHDLVQAMDTYGVRLFDLNVRQEIPNSAVNKEIVKSVQHDKTRKLFHHLNNGLLVACNHFAKKGEDRICLSGPQIVNGCQTVSSLYHAYKSLPPREQRLFETDVRIQVKVIQNASPELLEQIVISTNNQNPMKARNLKSNSPEQKAIQRAFRELPAKWFYVRKDGEFEALCAAGKRVNWFRRKDYQAELPSGSRAKDRVIDNVSVAKSWYSWIGSSHAVLTGGKDYFGTDTLYERVFRKSPSAEYWRQFLDADFEGSAKAPMDERWPAANQYLLAHAVSTFLRSTGISSYQNRREALMRGIEKRKLQGNLDTCVVTSSVADQAAWLAQDSEYTFNTYLNNMEDILVELFAFSLASRYGTLSPLVSRQILQLPDVNAWQRSGFLLPPATLVSAYPADLLTTTAAFVRWSVKNYCAQNKYLIDAAPRAKMFFGKRETVRAMRAQLLQDNELSASIVTPWKSVQSARFFDTLPALDVDVVDVQVGDKLF